MAAPAVISLANGGVFAASSAFVSPQRPSRLKALRSLVASVTAALWLLTGFAAVSAEFHHCLHEDAGNGQHECLVTKYSDGQFLHGPPAAILNVPPAVAIADSRVAIVPVFLSVDFRLPPGRAPPIS
jgi:hypothetical protein